MGPLFKPRKYRCMTLSINNKRFFKTAMLSALFFGFFLGFNNGNASAVENKTVNYTSGTTFTWNQQMFPDCTTVSCLSEYKYLIVNSTPSDNKFIGFRTAYSNLTQDIKCYNSSCVFELQNRTDMIGWRGDNLTAPYDFSLTLTDTFGTAPPTGTLNVTENGTFNVTNYGSVVVDVPQTIVENIEDPISNDFQKVFFTIVQNIIPAFGILLVVWFGIDMLSSLIFGRGR